MRGSQQDVTTVHQIPVSTWWQGTLRRPIESFAGKPDGGLMLPPDATTSVNRDLIVALAARHRLPAVYSPRLFVVPGVFISYGVNFIYQSSEAASYVDRILHGENPADLPVQAPTKFELVINLKTAKALGLTALPTLLASADEVIECVTHRPSGRPWRMKARSLILQGFWMHFLYRRREFIAFLGAIASSAPGSDREDEGCI
jgi:ABC transporter substrate binding protein